MNWARTTKTVFAAVLAAASTGLLLPAPAAAQAALSEPGQPLPYGDPQALSVGVPIRIQDALAPPTGSIFFQTADTTTVIDRENDKVTSPLSETIKLGLAQGFALNLGITRNIAAGSGPAAISPSFQYVVLNNNRFKRNHPIVSIEGNYTPSRRSGFSGPSYGMGVELTDPLGDGRQAPRLHVNFDLTRIDDRLSTTRRDVIATGVGLSFLNSDRVAIVTDLIYSQASRLGDDQYFADTGMTYLFNRHLAMSAGAGIGADRGMLAGRIFVSLTTALHVGRLH